MAVWNQYVLAITYIIILLTFHKEKSAVIRVNQTLTANICLRKPRSGGKIDNRCNKNNAEKDVGARIE